MLDEKVLLQEVSRVHSTCLQGRTE